MAQAGLFSTLDRAFNPKVVAVVGDKRETNYMWLRCMKTFSGKVYSVQVDENELPGIQALGVENRFSLLDIPEPVDYVIVAVPRGIAPRIVADCIKKGVGGATLFTSGFAETGTEEGIKLQETVTQLARDAKLNLVGPNCMGIFNPRIGLRNSVDQYSGEGGAVAFVSQSGTHSIFFSLVGSLNGVKVSKTVSYGNGVVLDSPDYLQYFSEDTQTNVIGMYIEGVKEGRRLFETLKGVAARKPVIIWKGGQTVEGARACASHTASLAQSANIWEALIKQCGAIKTDSLDETVDVAQALLHLMPPKGSRVGLIAMTGGQSVVISDTFSKAGLEIPLLTESSYREFAAFFTIIGGSYRNPLDISSNFGSLEQIIRMLDLLEQDDNVDTVVMELSVTFLAQREERGPRFTERQLLDALSDFRRRSRKPFLCILFPGFREAKALELRKELVDREIATFPSFERGARAMKKLVDYYRFRDYQG